MDHSKCGILKDMGIRDRLACLLRNLYSQSSQEVTEHYMEQGTGSKLGWEYEKGVYYYPAYLTYMQCTYNINIYMGGISITSDRQMTSSLWQKVKT